MLNKYRDFDDQFFRMVSISLSKTLTKQIRWINRFEDYNRRVLIPFYMNLAADEQFVFDAFVDDIVDKRVTLNTDQKQRGSIKIVSISTKSDEFANPNEYLAQKVNINGKLRKILSKVKAVPITITYDIEIKLDTNNEVDKAMQKIIDMLFNYYFFNIDYYGLKIDANLTLPDDKTITVPEEITLETDNTKKIAFTLNVQTYYPIFQINADDLIVCDNDNEINWETLGVQRPTSDFEDTLKKQNESLNVLGISGLSGSTEIEGATQYKRVYWTNYFQQYETVVNRSYDPRTWSKEDFNNNFKETPTDNPDQF